jgi:hypothetical protein
MKDIFLFILTLCTGILSYSQNQNIIIDNSFPYHVNQQTLGRATIGGDNIFISWPDSHKTLINFQDIKFLQHPRKPEKALWKKDFLPTYYDWNEF